VAKRKHPLNPGKRGAGGTLEGRYQKGQALACKAEGIELFKKGEAIVYGDAGKWQKSRTGRLSHPLGSRGQGSDITPPARGIGLPGDGSSLGEEGGGTLLGNALWGSLAGGRREFLCKFLCNTLTPPPRRTRGSLRGAGSSSIGHSPTCYLALNHARLCHFARPTQQSAMDNSVRDHPVKDSAPCLDGPAPRRDRSLWMTTLTSADAALPGYAALQSLAATYSRKIICGSVRTVVPCSLYHRKAGEKGPGPSQ